MLDTTGSTDSLTGVSAAAGSSTRDLPLGCIPAAPGYSSPTVPATVSCRNHRQHCADRGAQRLSGLLHSCHDCASRARVPPLLFRRGCGSPARLRADGYLLGTNSESRRIRQDVPVQLSAFRRTSARAARPGKVAGFVAGLAVALSAMMLASIYLTLPLAGTDHLFLRLVLSATAVFSFFPFTETLFQGQIDPIIVLLCVAGIYLFRAEHPVWSALCFAVGT